MGAIVGPGLSTFFAAAVAGSIASNVGLLRRDLLLTGESGSWVTMVLLTVLAPSLLLGLAVGMARVAAFGTTTRLTVPRVRLLFYGCIALGFAAGFCLIFLWSLISDTITPGRTNPPSYSDMPVMDWHVGQWLLYLVPPIVHLLAAVLGIVLVAGGARGVGTLTAAANEVRRRRLQSRPPGGSRLKGTVVAAEPAPQDPTATRLLAQVSAPEGTRVVEAIVPGTDRDWLPGCPAVVHVSNAAPYDPDQTLIDARRLLRAQGFFATSCPRPAAPQAGMRPIG